MSPLEFKETRSKYLKSLLKSIAVVAMLSGFSIAIAENIVGSGKKYWSLVAIFTVIGVGSSVSAHNDRLASEERAFISSVVDKGVKTFNWKMSNGEAGLYHDDLISFINSVEDPKTFNESHLWSYNDLVSHCEAAINEQLSAKIKGKQRWKV